jgi:protein tyrosine/serine phosphatase
MRFVATGLVLFAAACSPTSGAPTRSDVPIDDFAEVATGVYRGAQPDAEGLRALRAMGVRTIVDLRAKHDDAPAAALGFDVVNIPMSSFPTIAPPTDDETRKFLDVVTDPARRPVFFHCAEGKDRTGTMCALYRIEVEGWTPERAVAEMHAFGYHDVLYAGLEKFVRGYTPRGLAKAAAPPR